MIFRLVKDLPWMSVITFFTWLIVLVFSLKNLYGRKDLSSGVKVIRTSLFIILPVLGMLLYSLTVFRKNRLLFGMIVTALIISITDIWYFIEYAPTHHHRDISNEPFIKITPAVIINEFQSNETLADSKYGNKMVEISGTVEKVEADSTTMAVILKTGIPNAFVSCHLKKREPGLSIPSGAGVTVKGIVTGFLLDQVQLSDAIITNLSVLPDKQLPVKVAAPGKDTAVIKPGKDTAGVKQNAVTNKKVLTVKTIAEKETNFKPYTTNKARVKFFSGTAEEDIEAINSQVISSLNGQTGQVMFAALIKGFHFENELMQNHFNDKEYMNSGQFPKSEFTGNITNIKSLHLSEDGSYPVTATGSLTIHGVAQKIAVTGILTVKNRKPALKSVFRIKKTDYGITTSEVADILEITVTCQYD